MRYWHTPTLSKCKFLLAINKAESKSTLEMVTTGLLAFVCCPHLTGTQSHLICTLCKGYVPKQQRGTAVWVRALHSPHPVIKAGSTWNENGKELFDGVHWVHQHHSVLLVSQFLLSLINHFGHLRHPWGTKRRLCSEWWSEPGSGLSGPNPPWLTYYKEPNPFTDTVIILPFYVMLYFQRR